MLDNLKSIQERGYPADLLTRPMMGVMLAGNITAENAAQYGLPVDYGALLTGTLANNDWS